LCSVDGCNGAHRARGLCSKHWKQEYGTRAKYEITCQWCGAQHMSARKDGVACSADHRAWFLSYEKLGATWSDVVTKQCDREMHGKDGANYCRAYARTCSHCGAAFIARDVRRTVCCPAPSVCGVPYGECVSCGGPMVAVGGAKYCPGSCRIKAAADARSEARHKRRARERDAYVAPVSRHAVFKRDAYTCQLCGVPLDMEAKAPHPLSPSIDHVIPLAKGGAHEPGNVQAAHFLCNSTKGDRE
jgi:5-methylcytosine-specific restriction endonuclease McrA